LPSSRVKVYARRHRKPAPVTEFILPNHIKEIRQAKYLSQKDISDKLGVHKSTVSLWENHLKGVRDKNKIELCRFLKCEITTLFDWGTRE
jgi:DNA-binding transcriptional regulator YiaG